MEPKKYLKLDLVGIYNKAHVRDIVAVHKSMFYETIMSIDEDDSESGVPIVYELEYLDST